jgi:hypothetical protein
VSDDGATDPRLLAWRIGALERIEKAQNLEIHELRRDTPQRSEVYSKAEARELFVMRSELEKRASVRREWPIILCAIAMVALSTVTLIVTLGGSH